MGYNTTVFLLNDGFDQLQKNPEEFVRGISEHMHSGGTYGVGNHCNNVQVMTSQHADMFRLYGSERNLMVELSPWNADTKRLVETHPDVIKRYISQAKFHLEHLEKLLASGT